MRRWLAGLVIAVALGASGCGDDETTVGAEAEEIGTVEATIDGQGTQEGLPPLKTPAKTETPDETATPGGTRTPAVTRTPVVTRTPAKTATPTRTQEGGGED